VAITLGLAGAAVGFTWYFATQAEGREPANQSAVIGKPFQISDSVKEYCEGGRRKIDNVRADQAATCGDAVRGEGTPVSSAHRGTHRKVDAGGRKRMGADSRAGVPQYALRA